MPSPLTLEQAVRERKLAITEVSDAGDVTRLLAINRGNQPVLLVDGEELLGAKQNRALNTSVWLKPRSETIIPVFCTEQHRWERASDYFTPASSIIPWKIRTRMAVGQGEFIWHGGSAKSSQEVVWESIAALQSQAGIKSITGALQDVVKSAEWPMQRQTDHFPIHSGQQGLVVLKNGRVLGFDLLPVAEAYAPLHGKLVRSYVFDGLMAPPGRSGNPERAAFAVTAFLKQIQQTAEFEFRSNRPGREIRYRHPELNGHALVMDGQLAHAVFLN